MRTANELGLPFVAHGRSKTHALLWRQRHRGRVSIGLSYTNTSRKMGWYMPITGDFGCTKSRSSGTEVAYQSVIEDYVLVPHEVRAQHRALALELDPADAAHLMDTRE